MALRITQARSMPVHFISIVAVLAILQTSLRADPSGSTTPAKVEWASGKKFDQALDQAVVATWQNAQLRSAVHALSEQRRIPVVIDRRLDPNRMFSLVTRGESLREVWPQLAKVVDGGVSNTGQTIYLGPPSLAGKLRTLIALRQDEIQQLAAKLPTSRRQPLTSKRPLHWDDLDTPRDIVQQFAAERGLQINGLEQIQHDLWGAADLPPLTLAEAATLLLIQVDLTFRMKLDDQTVTLELVPIPSMVSLEKSWPLPRTKREAIAQAINEELPDLTTQATAEQLVARGTQEQLDELEQLIRTMSTGGTVRKKPPAPAPLSKRRITFQAKDAPLTAILDKLTETGIEFAYDRAALKQAGIDINQLVAIDVKDARPEDLFESLFKPLKISYEIDGLKVRLTPHENAN